MSWTGYSRNFHVEKTDEFPLALRLSQYVEIEEVLKKPIVSSTFASVVSLTVWKLTFFPTYENKNL